MPLKNNRSSKDTLDANNKANTTDATSGNSTAAAIHIDVDPPASITESDDEVSEGETEAAEIEEARITDALRPAATSTVFQSGIQREPQLSANNESAESLNGDSIFTIPIGYSNRSNNNVLLQALHRLGFYDAGSLTNIPPVAAPLDSAVDEPTRPRLITQLYWNKTQGSIKKTQTDPEWQPIPLAITCMLQYQVNYQLPSLYYPIEIQLSNMATIEFQLGMLAAAYESTEALAQAQSLHLRRAYHIREDLPAIPAKLEPIRRLIVAKEKEFQQQLNIDEENEESAQFQSEFQTWMTQCLKLLKQAWVVVDDPPKISFMVLEDIDTGERGNDYVPLNESQFKKKYKNFYVQFPTSPTKNRKIYYADEYISDRRTVKLEFNPLLPSPIEPKFACFPFRMRQSQEEQRKAGVINTYLGANYELLTVLHPCPEVIEYLKPIWTEESCFICHHIRHVICNNHKDTYEVFMDGYVGAYYSGPRSY